MTLVQAIFEVQSWFAQWSAGVHQAPRQILSGGELVNGDMPALYASEELAIDAWRDAMRKATASDHGKGKGGKKLIWVDAPRVEAFRITIADKGQTHRIADDRYTVTCRFAIESIDK